MASHEKNASTVPKSQSHERGLPSLAVLATIGAFGLAAGWLNGRILTGASGAVTTFRHSSWYTVWSALGALAVALWLVLGCITLRWLWWLSREEGGTRSVCVRRILWPALGYAVYGAVVSGLAAYLSNLTSPQGSVAPLADFTLRVNLFGTAAVFGSVPSAVSLWIIRRRVRFLPAHYNDDLPGGFEEFRIFQQKNQRSLSVLSVVIATAVFQTSALRNALLESGTRTAVNYPTQFVFLYGLIFAVAIAIIYLPSELALREAGLALQTMAVEGPRSTTLRQSGDAVESWLEQVDQRDRIGKVLGLDAPLFARVQTSLGLLSPLLASLIGTLLPH